MNHNMITLSKDQFTKLAALLNEVPYDTHRVVIQQHDQEFCLEVSAIDIDGGHLFQYYFPDPE